MYSHISKSTMEKILCFINPDWKLLKKFVNRLTNCFSISKHNIYMHFENAHAYPPTHVYTDSPSAYQKLVLLTWHKAQNSW